MATNKILPWAQTGTANVLSDDAYAADVATGGLYGDGVKTGQASSKQANKTWRQATAPGSGLSQFLVDNLSVDVTDADTPATFSSRIANAILKLAQVSPFNQSFAAAIGGYRKYAIVSDSSGNFWVSTADQNVTVPGASGAKWQSLFNGYATQSWAEDRYIRSPANPATDYRIQTISRNKDSGGIFAFAEDGSNTELQPAGDYVLKTGDTINWLTTTGGSVTTTGYSGNDGVYGGTSYATGLISTKQQDDTPLAIYRFINQNGVGPFASIWLTDNQGNGHELRFGADDRLRTASGNVFALTSELPLSAGQKIFIFTATVTDTQDIALPQAMSNVLFVTAQGGTDGKGIGMTTVNSWTNSTVNVTVASYHTGAPQRATITQTFLAIAIP